MATDRVPWPPRGTGYLKAGGGGIQSYNDISSTQVKLTGETQQAYRDIRVKLKDYLREGCAKVSVTEGVIHFTFQMILQIPFFTLANIMRTGTVKDVVVWNMKAAKDLESAYFNSSDVTTSSGEKYADYGTDHSKENIIKHMTTPMGSHAVSSKLLPIVLECVLSDPTKGESETPDQVEKGFSERYTMALQNKNDQVNKLIEVIPVKYDMMKITDVGLLAAVKNSIALFLIEFDEEEPYISSYETVSYTHKDVSETCRLHVINFLNPATVSARKLAFIRARFLAYIKTIKFTIKEQERSNSADGIVLSFIYSERIDSSVSTFSPGTANGGGMMRAKTSASHKKSYTPY